MATTDRRTAASVSPVTPTSAPNADPFFNAVKYGAIGDNAQDSTVQIQNAIDDARAGGIVFIPGGTYIVSGLNLYGRVILQGAGSGATVLRMKSGATGDVVHTDNFAGLTGTNQALGPFAFGIRDLDIDGNMGSPGTSAYGLRIYGYDYFLENVRVRYCSQDGIYAEWSNTFTPPTNSRFAGEDNDSMSAHWSNVSTHNCGKNGVNWNGPHDSTWINVNSWRNGQASGASGFVIGQISGFPVTSPLQAFGCHAWGTSHQFGWLVTTPLQATDCTAESASACQVVIDSNDVVWNDGHIVAHGGAPLGIQLGANTNPIGCKVRTTVENCTSGAVLFERDGGGNAFDLRCYQTSGVTRVGSMSSNTDYKAFVFGGGGANEWIDTSTFLQFGGDGSPFARLKSVATELQSRNSADSAYVPVEASQFLLNNNSGGFMIIETVGGGTMLKGVATELQARDSSDSTYIPMEASQFIVNDGGNVLIVTAHTGGTMLKGVATELQSRDSGDSSYEPFAGSAFNVASSQIFKTNVRPFMETDDDLLTRIAAVNAKRFNVKKNRINVSEDGESSVEVFDELVDERDRVGFIAEEFAEQFPDMVNRIGGGSLGIDYGALTPILFEAIKRLDARIRELEHPPVDPEA